MLEMTTRDGVPVIDALALMAQEGGMGTFEAIRRSLTETAGAGRRPANDVQPQPRAGNRNPGCAATATSTSRTSSFRSSRTPGSRASTHRPLPCDHQTEELLTDERPV